MRVYLGSDHAGLETKNAVIQHLRAAGHETVDCGAHVYDALDDYEDGNSQHPRGSVAAGERFTLDGGSLLKTLARPQRPFQRVRVFQIRPNRARFVTSRTKDAGSL